MSSRALPPLNAIRAFEAAARHGSLKAAADELGVTHGAVSRQLRLLQEWLGGPDLFHRAGRGVSLTPAGERLHVECNAALDRLALAARRHRTAGTVLRVNALATFSLRWLMPRLSRLRETHPGMEVRLDTSNAPLDQLAEEYDVIVRGGPDSFEGFVSRHVMDERRLPVCSPSLLAREPLRQVSDLERHVLLHVATVPRLWSVWLAEAGAPGLLPAAAFTLDHFYLSIQAALDGLGVAIGPTALVADDLAAGRLVAPFPDISLAARSYFAYLPARMPANPEAEAFCDWLTESAAA